MVPLISRPQSAGGVTMSCIRPRLGIMCDKKTAPRLIILVEYIFIDIFPAKTYNNSRDGKPSSGEFLPDSGKLYIQESSCQIVENFINQEIPCQTVGNFKIEGWSL